jgi:hypothetical protein
MGTTPGEVGYGHGDQKLRSEAGFDPTTIPTISDEEAEARREKARLRRKGQSSDEALNAAEAGVADLEANPGFPSKYAEARVEKARTAMEGVPSDDQRWERLGAIMERLETAIKQNTTATADNSRSAGGGRQMASLTSQRLSRTS